MYHTCHEGINELNGTDGHTHHFAMHIPDSFLRSLQVKTRNNANNGNMPRSAQGTQNVHPKREKNSNGKPELLSLTSFGA